MARARTTACSGSRSPWRSRAAGARRRCESAPAATTRRSQRTGRVSTSTLAQRFAREAGLKIEWVRFRWPELAADVAADRFDVAMSGVTWIPERATIGRRDARGGGERPVLDRLRITEARRGESRRRARALRARDASRRRALVSGRREPLAARPARERRRRRDRHRPLRDRPSLRAGRRPRQCEPARESQGLLGVARARAEISARARRLVRAARAGARRSCARDGSARRNHRTKPTV